MAEDEPEKSKTLSKKQASLLGSGLFIFGAALILTSLGSIEGPAAFLVVVGVGSLTVGTWVSTVAKGMKEAVVAPDDDDKNQDS